MSQKSPKLFIPGPVDVAPEILEAITQPMIGHRSPEFSELYKDVTDGIRRLLKTDQSVYLSSSSATGLWEAAVKNVDPKRTLCCVNGAFSSRWHRTVVDNGYEADAIEAEWGKAIKPEMIEEALKAKDYDLITFVHNETSTGVASPLQEISNVIKKFPDMIFAVDAVSSMMGMEINIDGWGIDICLASVQKCWALPPGFSICTVSDNVLARSEKASNKGYYFDFIEWDKSNQKNQTVVTPSIPHMYGLQAQIKRIEAEGLKQRIKRYAELALQTRDWAAQRGQSMFSQEGFHSDTVSCMANDQGWDLSKLSDQLFQKGYRFSNGYGKLKGSAFRIPHMGETTEESLSKYLREIDSLT